MKRRTLYFMAFASLVLAGGCAYEWSGRHGVIDTLYETFVVSRRSAEDRADYEEKKFLSRD